MSSSSMPVAPSYAGIAWSRQDQAMVGCEGSGIHTRGRASVLRAAVDRAVLLRFLLVAFMARGPTGA